MPLNTWAGIRIKLPSPTAASFPFRKRKGRGRKSGDPKREVSIGNAEFIRAILMHVLPKGFQKIRYYGFLNKRMKKKNLGIIFRLQRYPKFKVRFTGLSMGELLKTILEH